MHAAGVGLHGLDYVRLAQTQERLLSCGSLGAERRTLGMLRCKALAPGAPSDRLDAERS